MKKIISKIFVIYLRFKYRSYFRILKKQRKKELDDMVADCDKSINDKLRSIALDCIRRSYNPMYVKDFIEDVKSKLK